MPAPLHGQEVIADSQLRLRSGRPEDAARWFETLTDPVQRAWGTPAFVSPPADEQALAARIDQSASDLSQLRPGTLVVAGVEDDLMVAEVAWRFDVPEILQIADVGYSVHPAARGRGVATGATRLLVRWLFGAADGPRLHRVQCSHSVENGGSCRVAVRSGLAREGVRRSFLPMRDDTAPGGVRRHDLCLHGAVNDG